MYTGFERSRSRCEDEYMVEVNIRWGLRSSRRVGRGCERKCYVSSVAKDGLWSVEAAAWLIKIVITYYVENHMSSFRR